MSDYKKSSMPKVNFILKITMEYAASTPSGLRDISMEFYVYKVVKNNKADEKQSRRPSLLIIIMLYFNPEVLANSNKNGLKAIKIIMPSFLLWIARFRFQSSSSLSVGWARSHNYLHFTEEDMQALNDLRGLQAS